MIYDAYRFVQDNKTCTNIEVLSAKFDEENNRCLFGESSDNQLSITDEELEHYAIEHMKSNRIRISCNMLSPKSKIDTRMIINQSFFFSILSAFEDLKAVKVLNLFVYYNFDDDTMKLIIFFLLLFL